MKILITGATGFIGNAIITQCIKQNIKFNYLTTNKDKLHFYPSGKGFLWNPYNKEIDTRCIKNVNVIIHLAGASISKRWTTSYKKEIVNSRVLPTQLLFQTLKNNTHNIKQIIAASAIGIYPSSLVSYYTEDETQIGSSFLADVVQQWETNMNTFESLNIKVAKIRIGLVLSNKGGAFQKIVTPFKYRLGAAFGNGKQWQSWIHLKDLTSMFFFILQYNLHGVYNGVAPNPVTNLEFVKNTAKIMQVPLWVPNIPELFLKLILGEMHQLLFLSQRVSSKKIENKGFLFEYRKLKLALNDIITK